MTQGSGSVVLGSVVLRGGTVLTVDATHRVLPDTDVLVTGDRIAEIGARLQVPEGTREIDASGGRLGGRGSAQAGYVLGIVGTIILVLGVVVIAVAVAVGGFAFTFNAGT